jgi:hypothetical protein
MGSGPTPATQTQQTQSNQSGSSSTGPSQFLDPFLKQIIGSSDPGNSGGIAGAINQGPPSLYPGSYTAAPSDYTNQAIAGMANYQNPYAGANTALTNATLQGDYLNVDKNPYFQDALAASLRPATENFTNSVIPALQSTFAGAGRPGAGLGLTALQTATTNFDRAATDSTVKAGAQAYSDERQRQLATQGMLPQFQSMDAQRLAMGAQAGSMQDAYNQKLTDEQVQRYNYGQTGGLDFLTGLAQRLQAAYPGGYTSGSSNTSGTTTGTGTPASNQGASTMSTIMGGVGTAASIASMFV